MDANEFNIHRQREKQLQYTIEEEEEEESAGSFLLYTIRIMIIYFDL